MKTDLPIGILGDGQLALMLGEAAESQGIDFLGFGADPDSSFAVRYPNRFTQGSLTDRTALNEFARRCSVLTLENEFIPEPLLRSVVADAGVPIVPDPDSYRYFQDKISQRIFFEEHDIPGPKWLKLENSRPPFTFPFVVKAAQGGYDGYGVRIVANETEFQEALLQFRFAEGREILIEEKVAIVREFAQGVLLDGRGNVVFLPLVETIQRNGTCELALSRSTLPSDEVSKIANLVKSSLQKLAKTRLQGLFNFEFFYTQSGSVLINEGAPRPHNSQHLTIDASSISQFGLLMKYLAEGKLQTREIEAAPSVMINLLGKSKGSVYSLTLPAIPEGIQVFPKLYLKKECRPGRKMGHLNLVDPSGKNDLLEIGEKILKEYQL